MNPSGEIGFPVELDDGARITVRALRRPGAPRLILGHGNGFAMAGYRCFWDCLKASSELVLVDFRNHGRNGLMGPAGHDWRQFQRDFAAVLAALPSELGERRTIGVLHSLAAVVGAGLATDRPGLFDGLMLIDPSMPPPPGHALAQTHRAHMEDLAARTLRRRRSFAEPEVLAGQFRRAFPAWRPGAHEDLARAILCPVGNEWQLACAPELEARIYLGNDDGALWGRLAGLPIPVTILAADPNGGDPSPIGAICAAMAGALGLSYQALPGASHFLQIEQPVEAARLVERFVSRIYEDVKITL